MTEEIKPRDARQGRSNLNILIVLIVSLCLMLLAFGIFEWADGVPG